MVWIIRTRLIKTMIEKQNKQINSYKKKIWKNGYKLVVVYVLKACFIFFIDFLFDFHSIVISHGNYFVLDIVSLWTKTLGAKIGMCFMLWQLLLRIEFWTFPLVDVMSIPFSFSFIFFILFCNIFFISSSFSYTTTLLVRHTNTYAHQQCHCDIYVVSHMSVCVRVVLTGRLNSFLLIVFHTFSIGKKISFFKLKFRYMSAMESRMW